MGRVILYLLTFFVAAGAYLIGVKYAGSRELAYGIALFGQGFLFAIDASAKAIIEAIQTQK